MGEVARKTEGLKLNLGCGTNKHDGYVNVDKYGDPDLRCDLEHFPWPWEDNTVDEIVLSHVLEHLGQTTETYKKIWQEMYRVCRPGAVVCIVCPHPRHEHFIGDPTHVRPIHLLQFSLLSKKNCADFEKQGAANSQLARYWNVDFEVEHAELVPDPRWKDFRPESERTIQNLAYDAETILGVVAEVKAVLRVVK